MRETRILMGMPITIEVVGSAHGEAMEAAFAYLSAVDRRFSTYRPDSEITAFNKGRLSYGELSAEMREVFGLAEKTRLETGGYFDMRRPDGPLDPSGVVKGWAIRNAATLLGEAGASDFFVDAGGDIQPHGRNARGEEWRAGIRSPFDQRRVVKTLYPKGRGVATSGTYVRGQHIYDPHARSHVLDRIVSLTVVGPDVLEADRFATAAFAMGPEGIRFIESRPGLEGYLIDAAGMATMTSGFEDLTRP